MEYLQIMISTILFAFIFFLSFFWKYSHCNNGRLPTIPINLPVFGMFPSIMLQWHRLHDYVAEFLQQTQGTFIIKGPWFTKLELLVTADPTNVEYIMCKHHQDFHRSGRYREKLDFLGEGLIVAESDKWKYQRKIAISSITSIRFRQFIDDTVQNILEKRLTPFLDRSHKEGLVVDLQDVFVSLTTDITFKLLIGCDTDYLSFNPSSHPIGLMSSHALEQAMVVRHVMPDFIWKLQRKLGIGKERELSEYTQAVNDFAYEMIRKKREATTSNEATGGAIDIISLYMEEGYGPDHGYGFKSTDDFLRDTFANFLIAGRLTVSAGLSWFFWLLIKHPQVEAKIKEELIKENHVGNDNKQVYLHAAICEALRLYPPVPFVTRASDKLSRLPSGHEANPWAVIVVSTYAVGRMKYVWGEDCEEFKPERWITEKGTIKHEPSHKFCTFMTGPKLCVGKDMTFVEMKAVARHIISNGYWFQMVDGHRVESGSTATLHMKHGLKVKVMKNGAI